MATYKGIKGVKVQSKASDPTASEAGGTVWYNTATTGLKYSIASAGAWASGDAINQTRWGGIGSGIQTAALYTAGRDGGSSGNETESYNGTTWTAKNAVNQARAFLGAANQAPNAAAIVFGGSSPPGAVFSLTEIWDGTTWTETADMITARQTQGAGAVSTAALAISGYTTTEVTNVESWDGTSWTAGTAVNAGRRYGTAGGSTTDALFVAGEAPSGPTRFSTATEVWNGSTWTESADMDEGKEHMGSGITSGSSGIVFGGDTGGPGDDKTEIWNGSAWTEVAALATPREGVSGCGTAALAMDFGGYATPPGAYPTATEVWNDPVYTIKTVTVS